MSRKEVVFPLSHKVYFLRQIKASVCVDSCSGVIDIARRRREVADGRVALMNGNEVFRRAFAKYT